MVIEELFNFFPFKGQKPHKNEVIVELKLIFFAQKPENSFGLKPLSGLTILS